MQQTFYANVFVTQDGIVSFGEHVRQIEVPQALVVRQTLSGPMAALTGISAKSKLPWLVICQ